MAASDDQKRKADALPPPLSTLGKKGKPAERKPPGGGSGRAGKPPPPRAGVVRGGAASVANVPPPPKEGIPAKSLPPPPGTLKAPEDEEVSPEERDTAVADPEELSEEVAAFFDGGEDDFDEIDGIQERTTIPAPYSEDSARLMMERATSGPYPAVDPAELEAAERQLASADEEVRPSAVTKPSTEATVPARSGGLLANKLVLGIAGGVVVCLVVVLVVALSGGEDPSASAATEPAATGGSSKSNPDVENPAEAQSAKADEQAPAEQPEQPPAEQPDQPTAEPVADTPGQVKITLEGMPANATVKVNGVPVSPPLMLPRSDREVTLTVHATGYRSFWQKITPDHDRTIDVKMYRRGKGGKGGKGTMADNPWQ
jgi:hypothetical protein